MKTPLKHLFIRLSLVLLGIMIFPAAYLAFHYSKNHLASTETQAPVIIQAQAPASTGMFDIHHWVTAEGTKIVFVPLDELPIMDIQIVFAAGSAHDGDKFGSAQLLSQLIGEDTTEMTSDAIYDSFESVGAIFGVNVNQDLLGISLRTLTDPKYRDTALTTLETILGKTTFTQPAFNREQQGLLTSLTSDKQNPRSMIGDAFYEGLYGQHPYAHSVSGTTETVTALTLKDIQDFHQSYLVKENAIIAITGKLTLEEAQAITDKLVKALPSGKAAPSIPAIPPIVANNKTLTFPSSQTHFMMGLPTIQKGNPDYYALIVGNQVLGVMPLVNRLFSAVRVEEGLAYNISSSINTLKQPGPFTIYLQSRADEADKALTLVNQTVNSYLQTGPTEAELQSAKDNLYGQFAMGLSNNASITSMMATLAFYDLPWDYPDHYRENINAVTLEDVKRVFTQYIHPEEFTLIRLGEKHE